jgi:hypothetical protein
LKSHCGTGAADDIDELAAMLAANSAEAGIPIAGDTLCASTRPLVDERIAVDGRMLPHEWIQSPAGLVKTDALDHHDDDFFPGCRDIAWDLAGAIAEFGLNHRAASALVTAYRGLSGDAAIAARLPFYQAAYLAYRLGYVRLAAGTVADAADASRFETLYQTYRHQLEGTYARR